LLEADRSQRAAQRSEQRSENDQPAAAGHFAWYFGGRFWGAHLILLRNLKTHPIQ
jgi:hypothetical protein